MYAQRSGVGHGRERVDFATLRQNQTHRDCDCEAVAPVMNVSPSHRMSCADGCPPAMVYAPWQAFESLYDCEQWLEKGTIFKALDFPFKGARKGR